MTRGEVVGFLIGVGVGLLVLVPAVAVLYYMFR